MFEAKQERGVAQLENKSEDANALSEFVRGSNDKI